MNRHLVPVSGRFRRMRGVALVVVLWVIALLGVMATSFALSMRTESTLAHQSVQSAQSRALAEAGLYRAVMELMLPPRLQKWRVNGAIYEFSLGGGQVRVAIQAEEGRIDLNFADRNLLADLMRSVGVEEDKRDALADAILDWRDGNNLRSLHGAEDDDYKAAGLSYGAKDGPFNCVEELQQVLGMTPALYKRLEPALTVHSHEQAPQAQVAPPEVLRAIRGVAPGKGPGGGAIPGTQGPLSPRAGVTYTVQAAAKVSGAVVSQLTATLRLTPQRRERPFSVLSWREGGRNLFEKRMGIPAEPTL